MRIETLPHPAVDSGAPYARRVGLLLLATDLNSEADLRRMFPQDVGLFVNRLHHRNPMDLAALRRVADDVPRAGADILPGLALDATVFGCTSGTIAAGENAMLAHLKACCHTRHATTPVTASLAALAALGARRVSILTPYEEAVNRALGEYYASRGLEVLNVSGLGLDDDYRMTAITPEEIVAAGMRAMAADADALFISCTALRASLAVGALERALGRPVVTSNQAIAWHTLELIGHPGQSGHCGPGRLFGLGGVA